MLGRIGSQMLGEVLLQRFGIASHFYEGAVDRPHGTTLLMLRQLRATYPLDPAVVGTLHGIAETHLVMLTSNSDEGVLVPTVLTANLTILALLGEMLTDILPLDRVTTFVGTRGDCVATSWVSGEVRLRTTHFSGPLAPFLVVWAVDSEVSDPLLEMHITKVIEALCLARRAAIVLVDAFLNAMLTVVATTANYLARVLQNLTAQLADEFIRDFPDELVHGAIYVGLGKRVVHRYDL